jgi:hydroxypyruvate isomerase
MIKFSANLSMLYKEVDFLDRFDRAAIAGFKGVEYHFPYAFEIQQLVDRLGRNNLTQVMHNLPAGDWDAGERGIACHPDRVDEFQQGVDQAIEYASALDCKQVNVLAGITPTGVVDDVLQDTLLNNIRFAASKLRDAGISLLIEAINSRDIAGFYVTSTQQTLSLINASGSDNVFVQYDIYHMQVMEGDLATTIGRNLAQIAHIQLADNPGRNEPGTGEINFPFLFTYLQEIGYPGWIGCEYQPATTTDAGMVWLNPYLC